MDEGKHNEEAMLYQSLQMLEEVRLALNEVIDGTSPGPGAAFAKNVQGVIVGAVFFISLAAIYPVGPGADLFVISSLISRIAICAVAMFLAVRMSSGWAEGYVKKMGTWDEYISSRLSGYQAAKPDGLQYVKDHAVDGNLDAKVLKMWIEVEEVPALKSRLLETLPRPTIRITD